jgi:hypothetical protein
VPATQLLANPPTQRMADGSKVQMMGPVDKPIESFMLPARIPRGAALDDCDRAAAAAAQACKLIDDLHYRQTEQWEVRAPLRYRYRHKEVSQLAH